MNDKRTLLWVDDEIDLLKSHILYLDERGFEVLEATNGPDALEIVNSTPVDAVLIDEMMPVMDGLEVLKLLKDMKPDLPAIMVTKNEAEELMDQALGARIDAYLTKPVNPSQILSVLKRVLDKRKLEESQFSQRWAEGFASLSNLVDSADDAESWMQLHLKLCGWELELAEAGNTQLTEMLYEIRVEADRKFSRWVEIEYPLWIRADQGDRPVLSMDIIDHSLIDLVKAGTKPILFLVVDCLRLDQWLVLEPELAEYFDIKRETALAVLPTATPYSRNAIFSGLAPSEIEQLHPDLWASGDEDEASSNRFERQFMDDLLRRRGVDLQPEMKYVKVLESEQATEFEKRVKEYLHLPLTSMVYNFVDILLHTRQSVDILQEMMPDEAAFRSVTAAWFKHSSLFRIMKAYGEVGGTVILTSDHGSLRGRRGAKVIGDRETSTSLRYKHGRNLKCDAKQCVRIKNPAEWGLPKRGINTEYIIAREDYFFVYPTNYHRYLELYMNSFQHGGISLDEMVMPMVTMKGKG